MIVRAKAFPENNTLQEAFYRDALRLRPVDPAPLKPLQDLRISLGQDFGAFMVELYAVALYCNQQGACLFTVLKNQPVAYFGSGLLDKPDFFRLRVQMDKEMKASDFLAAELTARTMLNSNPRDEAVLERLDSVLLQSGDGPGLAMVRIYRHLLVPDDPHIQAELIAVLADLGLVRVAQASFDTLQKRLPDFEGNVVLADPARKTYSLESADE